MPNLKKGLLKNTKIIKHVNDNIEMQAKDFASFGNKGKIISVNNDHAVTYDIQLESGKMIKSVPNIFVKLL